MVSTKAPTSIISIGSSSAAMRLRSVESAFSTIIAARSVIRASRTDASPAEISWRATGGMIERRSSAVESVSPSCTARVTARASSVNWSMERT